MSRFICLGRFILPRIFQVCECLIPLARFNSFPLSGILVQHLIDGNLHMVSRDTATIEAFLQRCTIRGAYQLTHLGTVQIMGDISIPASLALAQLPIEFEWVTGSFVLQDCPELISLAGAPKTVGKDFDCSGCVNLTTLAGAPISVGETFYCSHTGIANLVGGPKSAFDYHCSSCDALTSLEGAPVRLNGSFFCEDNHLLTSLRGAPQTIGEWFSVKDCRNLVSLEGGPLKVGIRYDTTNCPVTEHPGTTVAPTDPAV